MHVYTATIGRNVRTSTYDDRDFYLDGQPVKGWAPMSDERWEQFIEDVKADMNRFAVEAAIHVDNVEIHRGTGFWDGVEEESAKITLLTTGKADGRALSVLRRFLSELARLYSQDAIALTIGQSELC